MSAKLKFRIWMPEAPHLYSETGMFYQDNQWLGSFLRRIHDQFGVRHDTYLPFEPEERMMQYTGLWDKNGKEIYEGDILEFEAHRDGGIYYKAKEAVRFDLGQFHINGTALRDYQNLEVVGNTYETPELLATPKE